MGFRGLKLLDLETSRERDRDRDRDRKGAIMAVKMEKNAAGRLVPLEVNGREGVPFKGVG